MALLMNPTAHLVHHPASSINLFCVLSQKGSSPMAKIHGFKLGKRFLRVSRWIFRKIRIRTRPRYSRLGGPPQSPTVRLLKWGHWITAGAKSLFNRSSYARLGSDPDLKVPKGHLAVYVGQKDGEIQRVMVPVIYFNHPLFGDLLREAEEEYGFQHQGGITIPCRVTEFERVRTRIASGSSIFTRRRLTTWR